MNHFCDPGPKPLQTKLNRLFEGIAIGDIISSAERKAISAREKAFREVEQRWLLNSPENAKRRFFDAQTLAVTKPTRENCEALAALGTQEHFMQNAKLLEMAAYNERRGMGKGNLQIVLPVLKKILEHLQNRLVILRGDVDGQRALLTTQPPSWLPDQIVVSFEAVAAYLRSRIEKIEASKVVEGCPQSPAGIINEFYDFEF
jgi:hypothetical protein